MNYTDLKVDFKRPNIWRRPSIEKLPKVGKTFNQLEQERESFDKLKVDVEKEIVDCYTKNIRTSQDINDINRRISEVAEHYGKAVIATDEIDSKFLLGKTNQNTLNKKLQGWCQNLVYNIPDIIKSEPYDELRDKFTNVPAFVCMAGPSLKNNAEKLKAAKGKSVIIAVDTSLRPLLEMGVVPDICVTHDANPNGAKFFLSKDHDLNTQNVQLNDMNDNELGVVYAMLLKDEDRLLHSYDTVGLFVNYCHPLTLLAWNGKPKRFYGVLDPSLPVYDVMSSAGNYKMEDEKLTPENKGRVIGGSSVGHVATYIAIGLGCNPISVLGLDLSYPGGKTYVEGASNQKDVSKQRLIDVDSLSGEKVKTNMSMLSYKMVFEQAFPHILEQRPDIELFNCTVDDKGRPSGILECGARPESIDKIIKDYCVKDYNIKERLSGKKDSLEQGKEVSTN